MAAIPTGVDVLITHGPPWGILDSPPYRRDIHDIARSLLGDETLTAELSRIKPRLHVFGHIHVGAGQIEGNSGTLYVNAAVTNVDFSIGDYVLARQPVVVDLDEGLDKIEKPV